MPTEFAQDNVDLLRAELARIDRIGNDEWMRRLDGRKKAELEFHDRDRDRDKLPQPGTDTYEKFYGNLKYYTATSLSKNYVDAWIRRQVPGKVFLDYACGNGFNAIRAAQCGAKLAIGIDISAVSVQNARADAEKAGVQDRTIFVQADAENTMLPTRSIDVVVCSGMLHHLDLSFAFPELRRLLAPGGVILAVEALDYNPFIKLYRMLTPAMRTEWEKAHILSLKDVRFGSRFFEIGEVRYWHVMSILGAQFPALLPMFNGIDRLLTRLPVVRLLAWMFTFELRSLEARDGK
jgi:SAM-dependent methyltransferase